MSASFKRISPQIWNSVFLKTLKRSLFLETGKGFNLLLSVYSLKTITSKAPSYKVVLYSTLVSLLTLFHVIQIVL